MNFLKSKNRTRGKMRANENLSGSRVPLEERQAPNRLGAPLHRVSSVELGADGGCQGDLVDAQ
eukprot:4425424-Pyramimonas_sp.AAC.1